MSYIIYVVVDGLVTTFLQACLILCSRDHNFGVIAVAREIPRRMSILLLTNTK
jgi:hypothetical protein